MTTKLVIAPSEALRQECERAMHVIFAVVGIPLSYLDADCRDGYMVRAARMFGCKPAVGTTHDPNVKRDAKRYARLVIADAREVAGRYDLLTYLRTAPPERGYIDHLLTDRGHLIVGSAFPVGKGAVNGLRWCAITEELQEQWARVVLSLPPYVSVYTK